jgi:3',5'-cyclic AMP phosphodiesterase CpdA
MDSAQSFTLQILSDVHTEFLLRNTKGGIDIDRIVDSIIQPKARYLALLGDIGCPAIQASFVHYQEFMSRLESKFEKVFVIAGNHEFYCLPEAKMSIRQVKERMNRYCGRKLNFSFMDKKAEVVDGIRVIGATLWTDISRDLDTEKEIVERIADFKSIYVLEEEEKDAELSACSSACRNITPDDMRKLFEEDLLFIVQQVEQAARSGEKAIILTHHPPSFKNTSAEEFRCQDGSNSFSSAFASDLEHLFLSESFQKSVILWAFGHTHHSSDQVIHGIRLVSNQVGYRHQNEKCELNSSCTIHF